ncbi:hypothetical protein ZIOFF_021390 [Zingiber officinale]|uniref:WAT1-related protein n=1 Tax=Zingiber officinale TaxID=94328 RepID=A0A8J5HIT3_ZINOF|nr:hypothetical protein ZIOFF_021390 [Zingiber officinale]
MASVKACAPYFYMIVSQFAYVGSSILGKLALGQGLSALVFVVYRHLIAMLILAPLAYVLERNRRPSFSFGVMLKIFILAMLGITIQQNVYYVGLHLISPTVASALGNVIPAFTFLLAIVLRMEKLNLKTVRGRARLAGTIFCITGALIFTFWKGHLLGAFVTSPMIQLHFETPEKGDAWLKGYALMLFVYFACSVSLVLQASICEIYPAKLTMNAVMCFFAALQSSALSLIFERNALSWRMFPLFTHLILCIVFVWERLKHQMCHTFLTPPLPLTTMTSSGESFRSCQQRRKFRPILPKPLISTFNFATVTPFGGTTLAAWKGYTTLDPIS